MRSLNLVDLSSNDGWQRAAGIINQNFKRLADSMPANYGTEIRASEESLREAVAEAVAEIERKVDDEVDRIEKAVAEADRLLQEKIDEANRAIADLTQPKRFAPPVGCYLFSDADPSTIWTDTVWQRQDQGMWLVSSGTGEYAAGSRVGQQSVTLTEAQLPHLRGDVWNMAQQSRNVHVTVSEDYGDGITKIRPATDNAVGYGTGAEIGSEDVDTSRDGFTIEFGGGQAHENRPPSLCVPLWKRTA